MLMTGIVQPKVMFGQQQKIPLCSVTFGCVIATAPTLREQFTARLRAVCIDKGLPDRGMQTQLAKKFDVSQQAARKWLDGASYPEIETIVRLADWGDVNVNWLLQGAGGANSACMALLSLLVTTTALLTPARSKAPGSRRHQACGACGAATILAIDAPLAKSFVTRHGLESAVPPARPPSKTAYAFGRAVRKFLR